MSKKFHTHNGIEKEIHLNGWKKQSVDVRDEGYRLKLHPSFLAAGTASTSIDLRSICSPIEDQSSLGSCTANMLAGMVESNEVKGGAKISFLATTPAVSISNIVQATDGTITYTTTIKPITAPTPTPTPTPTKKLIHVSRLAEYYATRKIEGTTRSDSGASIRNTIKAAYTYGVCDETLWPYDISKFAVNPSVSVWAAMASHRVTSYHSISDGDIVTMKAALAAGFLVGFGFTVYTYFMTQAMATNAFLNLPGANEQVEGGHAVCLVGYDDNKVNPFDPTKKGAFLVRNSWGTDWGLAGYFWMSYDYVKNTSLANDFWVIQSSPL
jgi:C1A family cysteine protease